MAVAPASIRATLCGGPPNTADGTFPVGKIPEAIAFDGAHMWVTNSGDDTVTELNADGSAAGTFPVGDRPSGIAFDGKDVWITNYGPGNVMKLRAG